MKKGDNITVIIVAGGSGSRMGGGTPKQFLPLAGKPVLVHTVERFASALPGAFVIVVLPAEQIENWEKIAETYDISGTHTVCAGGDTRFQSVKNALSITEDCDLVAVHDGVRPLADMTMILRCIDTAGRYGTAVPVVEPADSFRTVTGKGASQPADRSKLRIVQTPQVFRHDIITKAYRTDYRPEFTDDASVIEYAGTPVTLCEGDPSNIKITRPADMAVAGALLKYDKEKQ